MTMNGQKLGKLLMDADIVTKRQISEAIRKQQNGDKRKLGEILIEMGHVTVEDLTEVVMEQATKAESATEGRKRDTLLQKQITKSKSKPKLTKPAVAQPQELSEEKVLSTKFTLSLQTMITAGVGLSSLIGMWYALQAEIQLAKELPRIDNIYANEYPSKIDAHNWPSSMEQYEVQVGGLIEDMEGVYDLMEEYEEKIEDLEDTVNELRIKIASLKGG